MIVKSKYPFYIENNYIQQYVEFVSVKQHHDLIHEINTGTNITFHHIMK